MELYILRHAIAVDRGTPGYENDDERPLTDEGIKKMRAAADGIDEMQLGLDRIYTSPILRARQTAEIVADELKAKGILQQASQLGSDFSCEGVIDLLKKCGPNDKIMLVGHEPDVSELASFLLTGRIGVSFSFKKGALMRIDTEGHPVPGEGTLVWLLEPGHLRAIA